MQIEKEPKGNILIDLDNTMVVCNIYYQFAKTNLIKYILKISDKSEEELTALLEKFELERLNSIDAFSSKTFPEVFVNTLYAGATVNSLGFVQMTSNGDLVDLETATTHKNKVVKLAESVFNSAPYTIYPTVNDTLEKLNSRGYRLYIVSKGHFYTQLRKIQGLSNVFNGIFITPNKNSDVYSGLIKTIGGSFESTWMVGDSPSDDILAASEAGLKTVWVKRAAKTSWVGDPFVETFKYDHKIEVFSELLEIFNS